MWMAFEHGKRNMLLILGEFIFDSHDSHAIPIIFFSLFFAIHFPLYWVCDDRPQHLSWHPYEYIHAKDSWKIPTNSYLNVCKCSKRFVAESNPKINSPEINSPSIDCHWSYSSEYYLFPFNLRFGINDSKFLTFYSFILGGGSERARASQRSRRICMNGNARCARWLNRRINKASEWHTN